MYEQHYSSENQLVWVNHLWQHTANTHLNRTKQQQKSKRAKSKQKSLEIDHMIKHVLILYTS